jgi:hypothetical protein
MRYREMLENNDIMITVHDDGSISFDVDVEDSYYSGDMSNKEAARMAKAILGALHCDGCGNDDGPDWCKGVSGIPCTCPNLAGDCSGNHSDKV